MKDGRISRWCGGEFVRMEMTRYVLYGDCYRSYKLYVGGHASPTILGPHAHPCAVPLLPLPHQQGHNPPYSTTGILIHAIKNFEQTRLRCTRIRIPTLCNEQLVCPSWLGSVSKRSVAHNHDNPIPPANSHPNLSSRLMVPSIE